jgi:hypothetical protein
VKVPTLNGRAPHGQVADRCLGSVSSRSRADQRLADDVGAVSIPLVALAHEIADGHIVGRVTRATFMANQNFGLRLNGTLPLGVELRCAALLDAGDRTGAAHCRA